MLLKPLLLISIKHYSQFKMTNKVFNNKIGSPYSFAFPKLTAEEERHILAGLFEQLLVFDRITISTNRLSFPLVFLIKNIGINKVEELIERKLIEFMIWTPVLVTGTGRQNEDGTTDESVIYGQPPILAGSLSNEDLDPENNIKKALSYFSLHRDRKRIFIRKARKAYVVPNGMEFSSDSAKVVIQAFKQNNLIDLGLPYDAEPDQLTLGKRQLLLELGHKLLETAVLSKYELKSFENYEHYKICEQNLQNIGNALKVTDGTSEVLRIEGIPDLKKLFIQEKLDFENVTTLRYKDNSKYFRNWINSVSENSSAAEITKEYINEIKGKNKFFESTEGKFVRNIGMFGIKAALGTAIAGPIGTVAGFGLGLLETYWFNNILKGKNPSMFIEDLEKEIESREDPSF